MVSGCCCSGRTQTEGEEGGYRRFPEAWWKKDAGEGVAGPLVERERRARAAEARLRTIGDDSFGAHRCGVYVSRELVGLNCVAIILDTGEPSVLVEIRPDADPLWRGKILLDARYRLQLRSNIVIEDASAQDTRPEECLLYYSGR